MRPIALLHGVGVAGVLVTELQGTHEFGAIVGMGVICMGDFSVTNVAGKTWVSFRTPSCEAVDYVVAWNRERYAGVGRNQPCPCGQKNASGRLVAMR